MEYLLLLGAIAFVVWVAAKLREAIINSKMVYDDVHFSQAGVEIIFQSGTIRIKEDTYKVNQVTGIKAEPSVNSEFRGRSKTWNAIIELDDFKKPRHSVMFFSRNQANEFTQRLSTALRKAGGPSFS